MKKQRSWSMPLVTILSLLACVVLFMTFSNSLSGYTDVPTSRVVQVLDGSDKDYGQAKIKTATMVDGDQEIRLELDNDKHTRLKSKWVNSESGPLVAQLNDGVKSGRVGEWHAEVGDPGFLGNMLFQIISLAFIIGVMVFMFSSAQGGGGRVMNFGKSKAKIANKDMPKTTFADVAGCDEAIEELQEIKEFLSEPAKFQAVGAKIPKGVLLYGQPGTGKTLLARAVAGEAGVPFFSISGSDFVEMFVGVGASRVRDLFEQAKQNAPAIIFIDEIDAVGRHRGAGMGGGHDEREQTLNQLLVEMDGFDANTNVILIAATNRPDVLDPALLRPGRFDRQVSVDAPDLKGRYQILQVHSKGKPLGQDVDLASVARRTPGFTGADLANVLNEAALLTARLNLRVIGMQQLDEAIDRVVAGPQKSSRLMDEHEKLITAYHEGGHALVAAAMPANDPVQKITILPRGRALGYTMVMPDEDKYSQTRGELLDQLAYMLGGRAAEELVFHDPTTGASNDIEKATKVARAMVTQYGMSERIGAVRLGTGDKEPFMGMDYGGSSRDYSEEVAGVVDEEVKKLINEAHQEAFDALDQNRDVLDELVRQLFEHETLDKEQVARIFEPLKRRDPRGAWTGSATRIPSNRPPVLPPPTPRPALEDEPRPAGGTQLPPGQTPPPQLPPQQWPGQGGQDPDTPGGGATAWPRPGDPRPPQPEPPTGSGQGWPGSGPGGPTPPAGPGQGWPGSGPVDPTPPAGPGQGWPGSSGPGLPGDNGLPGSGRPGQPEPPSTGPGAGPTPGGGPGGWLH